MIYAKLMETLKDILVGVEVEHGSVMITKDNDIDSIELINYFDFYTEGSLLNLKDMENDKNTVIDLENVIFQLGYNRVHFHDGVTDYKVELV